jgi:hypothetical protein
VDIGGFHRDYIKKRAIASLVHVPQSQNVQFPPPILISAESSLKSDPVHALQSTMFRFAKNTPPHGFS